MSHKNTLSWGFTELNTAMGQGRSYMNVAPTRIPGLLQTDAYHKAGAAGLPQGEGRRLKREDLPPDQQRTFYIGATALRNLVGGPQTMHTQLGVLRSIITDPTAYPHDRIRIVSNVMGGFFTGDLIIVDDEMFSEGAVSLARVTDPRDREEGLAYVERVQAAAHPEDSLMVVEAAMRDFGEQFSS